MGTEITLEVGGMEVDYCKNSMGYDHGSLFQKDDRKRSHSDQINYEYFKDEEDPELAAMEIGFIKPLKNVLPRLGLLGFTERSIRSEYQRIILEYREYDSETLEETNSSSNSIMSFNEFLSFSTQHSIQDLDDTYIEHNENRDDLVRGRFNDPEILARIPYSYISGQHSYSEMSFFSNIIGLLHPYSLLYILGQNTNNLDLDVRWQYGPLVDAGWAKENEFEASARRKETFLIATEGSSDVKILQKALELLRPEVSDFFRFIDMDPGHPFPGTGNLHKFAEGLAKIDVHNQVVFLYDNDAEGVATYKRTSNLLLPANMRVSILPQHDSFSKFYTVGPNGESYCDINGRAAAIECYLDLQQPKLPKPVVRWANYNKDIGEYQGSLEQKNKFSKAFFKQTAETIASSQYDTEKLQIVLDTIHSECCDIAEEARLAQIKGAEPHIANRW